MENKDKKPQMEMKLKWWAKVWYHICLGAGRKNFTVYPKMRYFVEHKAKFEA